MLLALDAELERKLTPRQLQALVRINRVMDESEQDECPIHEMSLRYLRIGWKTWASMRPLLLDSGYYSDRDNGCVLVRHPEKLNQEKNLELTLSPPPNSPATNDGYTPAAWDAVFETHIWPRTWKRTEKKDARQTWAKLAPATGEAAAKLLAEVLDGMERYSEYCAANADWMCPQSLFRWLRSERWQDDYQTESDSNGGVVGRMMRNVVGK